MHWTDKSPVNFLPLHIETPGELDVECAQLGQSNGHEVWKPTNCLSNAPFICKMPAGVPIVKPEEEVKGTSNQIHFILRIAHPLVIIMKKLRRD